MKIPTFLGIASAVAIILVLIGMLLHTYWVPQTSQAAINYAILVGFLTAVFAYIINFNGLEGGNRKFFASVVVAMSTKMLVGIIIVVIVAVSYKHMVKEYVISYFFSYFIFTAFEVYGLMRKLRA
ncbi:MAG: hypothetical protein AAF587_29905 [Bacteroidota bacterium]